jgi:hypothetical protein
VDTPEEVLGTEVDPFLVLTILDEIGRASPKNPTIERRRENEAQRAVL